MFECRGCVGRMLWFWKHCSLMADSKRNVFGVGELIDVVTFGDLEKLMRVTAYVYQFLRNLKSQRKVIIWLSGNFELLRFVRLRKCGHVVNNQLFQKKIKNIKCWRQQ